MSRELVTPGQDLTIAQLDRSFGGRTKEILKISGVDGSVAYTTDVSIDGTLKLNAVALTGDQTVAGNLQTTGNTTVGGNLATTGNETVAGTLHAGGNTTLGGTLVTTGNTTVGGNLTVTGSVATVNGKNIMTDKVAPGQLPGTLFLSLVAAGADASIAATHITATGAKVGDKVIQVVNLTDASNGAASFEATVTVADQIQQPATDLTTKTFAFLIVHQS